MNRVCSLCRSQNIDDNFYKIKGYYIHRCNNCNLMFLDAVENDSSKLYSEKYFEGDAYNDYLEELNNWHRRRHFKKQVKVIGKYFNERGKLLEIGCAAGFFLKIAREAGWTVRGIEISQYMADIGRKKWGLAIHCADIDSVSFRDGEYDAVVMLDVIEHLKDPFRILLKINKALKENGLLYLSTGDFQGLNAKIFGTNYFLFMPPYHLWYFSHNNLPRYLEANGYKVISCKVDGNFLLNGYSKKYLLVKLINYSGMNYFFSHLNIGNVFCVAARKITI